MESQEPPPTQFGDELRALHPALENLERERLQSDAPLDLDQADDALDRQIAALDKELLRHSSDRDGLLEAAARLVCVVADLLAATVARDEKRESRHPVPLTSAPPMIEAFNDSMKVPVDAAVGTWRAGVRGTPLELWRYQLGLQLDGVRHGIAMSRLGTTVYHESEQSNQTPLVSLLAHCLSLWAWLLNHERE